MVKSSGFAAPQSPATAIPAGPASATRRLPSALGNQAALRREHTLLPSSRAIAERRLEIGSASDIQESHADATAHAAMRGEPAGSIAPVVRSAPPAELGLGAGRPLDASVRAGLAPTFGDSLGEIRIHDDAAGARAANQLDANAFSVGGHIAFRGGGYNPSSLAGRRLLAHELGHAVAGESRSVLRRDPRDYDREVSHLTTTEVEAELQAVTARLTALSMSSPESSPEYADLDRSRAALERAMVQRGRARTTLQAAVTHLRATDPLAMTVSPSTMLAMSMWSGFLAEVPPGTAIDASRALQAHPDQYLLGYLRGIPDGLWHGVVNLVEGLGSILVLAAELVAAPFIDAWDQMVDFDGHMRRQQAHAAAVREVIAALYEFARGVAADPSVLIQMNADLGFLLGQEVARLYADFAAQSPFEMGRDVGDVAGQVVFEILLEVLLAVATEGIGNVVRGIEAGATGARYSGRLVSAIRRMMEASPLMRRFLRSIAGLEHGAGAVRTAERTAETIEAGATVERRVAGAETHADDVARRVVDEAPAPRVEPPVREPVREPPVREPVREPTPREPAGEPPLREPAGEPPLREPAGEPPAPRVEETHAPGSAAASPSDAAARARARRAGNFDDVDGLVGHPAPDPLPPALRDHYRYVTNPSPPPPRSLRRAVADDERFAQLSVDTHGNIQYPARGRPTPDVPFDAELATPLSVPSEAHLTGTDALRDARSPGRTVGDAVEARRDAQAGVRRATAAGDREEAARQAARMRRESEVLGDAAGESYMRGRGTMTHQGEGANTLDQVWRNTTPPPEFTVIEAKGGAATNTSSRMGAGGVRYQQGTEGYLRSIIEGSLEQPPTARLPRDVARDLRRALDNGSLEYIEVTQPIASDGSLLAPVARRYF